MTTEKFQLIEITFICSGINEKQDVCAGLTQEADCKILKTINKYQILELVKEVDCKILKKGDKHTLYSYLCDHLENLTYLELDDQFALHRQFISAVKNAYPSILFSIFVERGLGVMQAFGYKEEDRKKANANRYPVKS